MKKRIMTAVALALQGINSSSADFSSNGVVVSGTPSTAVAATQTVGLDCSANQPVAKLIWHVDNIGWSGGDNVTSLRFPARDVLAALGGGAIQHVTARCSAVDANGVELANHDTIVTVYDPTHPDAFEPGSGAQSYIVPQAFIAVAERPVWEGNCSGGSTTGVIDPVPLQPEEAWRGVRHLTAAMVSGAPPTLDEAGYARDPNGLNFTHYCRSSLLPEPFPCPLVVTHTTGSFAHYGICEAASKEYAGNYVLGLKISRTNPLGNGFDTLSEVPLHHVRVDLRDSSPGEAYSVGNTEWALINVKFGMRGYTAPTDPFAANGMIKSGNRVPYLFYADENIGDNYDNSKPATEFVAGQEVTLSNLDLFKRLVDSNINGKWITLDEVRQNYRIVAIYQTQGDTSVDFWATRQSADGEIQFRATSPGRAVLFIAMESANGAINEHLMTFVFK